MRQTALQTGLPTISMPDRNQFKSSSQLDGFRIENSRLEKISASLKQAQNVITRLIAEKRSLAAKLEVASKKQSFGKLHTSVIDLSCLRIQSRISTKILACSSDASTQTEDSHDVSSPQKIKWKKIQIKTESPQ